MKSLFFVSLGSAILLGSAFAQANECTAVKTVGVVLAAASIENTTAAISIRDSGGNVETFNYRFRLTRSTSGIASHVDEFEGEGFEMTCNSRLQSCDVNAEAPRSAQFLSPGEKFQLVGVTCK